MYGVVIPDFLMNCWRDTPQQKHPHQTGIQKSCLVAKEPEHWFQHTFFCTAQIMHQWKQSEYHHPVGFKTVQWEEFNTDLLCDCTYLWAGRACSAITAVWTDSTHSTQLILQESVLIQHFELKQKLYHDVILVNWPVLFKWVNQKGVKWFHILKYKTIIVHYSIKPTVHLHIVYLYERRCWQNFHCCSKVTNSHLAFQEECFQVVQELERKCHSWSFRCCRKEFKVD